MSGATVKRRLSAKGRWGLVLIVMGVIALAAAAIVPFAWRESLAAEIVEKRVELRFIEGRLKAAKGGVKVRLTAADNIDPLFVAGTTPGLALAGLQDFVGKLASDNGMAVERLQPLQADNEGGLAVLRMEVEAAGSIESVRNYLLALEAGQPLIFVNRARIAAPEGAAAESAALPSEKLSVALQLEAYGWWEATP